MNRPPRAVVADTLAAARGGNRDAFASLLREHRRMVYGIALRMLGRHESAEDLAQEVFMQLHAKMAAIESSAHLCYWLRRVTTNRAIDQLRQESHLRLDALEPDAIAAPDERSDPLLQNRLRALLLQMTPAARAVMILRYQQDLEPVEIAATLDMPVNTVKSHLKRSLHELRRNMEAAS